MRAPNTAAPSQEPSLWVITLRLAGLCLVVLVAAAVLFSQLPVIINIILFSDADTEGPATEGPSQVWHVSSYSSSLAFSPGQDQDILAVGLQDGSIELRRASTGQVLSTVKAHGAAVSTLTFSHQGTLLASSADDGTARLWRLSTTTTQGGAVQSASLQAIANGGLGNVARLGPIAFSPDDKIVAAAGIDGDVKLYQITTGGNIGIAAPGRHGSTEEVVALSFSLDGGVLTLASDTGAVRHYQLSVSPGTSGITARLADTVYGRQVTDTGDRGGLILSQDGTLAATLAADYYSKGPGARLWSAQSGSDLAQLEGAGYSLSTLTFSADGKWLAGGEAPFNPAANGVNSLPTPVIPPPSYVHVWSTVDGHRTMLLRGHKRGVTALAFSPDGEWLASAGKEGTVRLWRNQRDR